MHLFRDLGISSSFQDLKSLKLLALTASKMHIHEIISVKIAVLNLKFIRSISLLQHKSLSNNKGELLTCLPFDPRIRSLWIVELFIKIVWHACD
jgi:hypothetical protein